MSLGLIWSLDMERIPSLLKFAGMIDPFENRDQLLKRLLQSKDESKYHEWKETSPMGPVVSKQTKYRTVKALISFANTAGGFVVCGVNSKGRWVGLTEEEFAHVDPSKMDELINGVISPEIQQLSITRVNHANKKFLIIHTPPSELMPHVTTREVTVRRPSGATRCIIAAKTVYYRFVGKSDVATPAAFQRIIAKRTQFLKTKLLRTIKEVHVPVLGRKKGETGGSGTTFRMVQVTDDPSAPAVRLTTDPSAPELYCRDAMASTDAYVSLQAELAGQVRLWKTDNGAYAAESELWKFYAARNCLELSPEGLQCLLVSSMHRYCPMYFWASRLGRRRLVPVVQKEIAKDTWPGIGMATVLACHIGGKVGAQMLATIRSHSQYPSIQKKAGLQELRVQNNQPPYNTPKSMTAHLSKGSKKLDIAQLLGDRERSEEFITELASLGTKEARRVVKALDPIFYSNF